MRKTYPLFSFHGLAVLIFVLIMLISPSTLGQSTDSIINLNEVATQKLISKPRACFISRDFKVAGEYSPEELLKRPVKSIGIAPENVTKKILMYFRVANPKDSIVKYYFFPGMYFSDTRLYKIKTGKPIAFPVIAPNHKDNVSFRLFEVPPHDTLEMLAEIFQVKTYTNTFRPRLINELYVHAAIIELQGTRKQEILFTYIFCGLLLMMVLFSLANFFQGGSREFLYYAAYAFFLGAMLFTKPYYHFRSNFHNFFFEAYLDFIFQCIGICFYMAFMILFLESKKNYPFLHRLYVGGIIGLSAVMILYTWLHYGSDNYFIEYSLENYITKGILLLMVIIFLIYAVNNWQNKLLRYLFWGNFFYLLFSIISLLFIWDIPLLKTIFPYGALIPYELGLLIELIFFLMGLTYKNRKQIIEQTREGERLRMENDRKELEKQMAVFAAHQEERDRISTDMHDELGSGVTTIRLMSEIAKNKMKGNIPVEIEKISASANDLLNKMNAIIWSMNSENDSVDNLVSYIRSYTIEYFDGTPINCKINTPGFIPDKELSGDKRRNIFLCIKETLNNVLKHSNATEMKMDIEVNDKLRIIIADNGVGIDLENIRRFGNGLKNIEKRIKSIGGYYNIRNEGGTISRFELPL